MTSTQAIQTQMAEFQKELIQYIETYFPQVTKFQLLVLYTVAYNTGLTNRLAYLQPLIDWIGEISSYSLTYYNIISALSDPSEILATQWDIPSNTSPVPNVTALGAIAITN